jgi:DNA-binding beta-propeller fold protein YncE
MGAVFACVLGTSWIAVPAQKAGSGQAGACNAAAAKPVSYVSLPGRPFGIAVTQDGCHVFVAVSREANGIAVLRREDGKIKVERVVSLPEMPTEIVLTHDNKLLIVADGEGATFLDVERMLAGGKDAVVGHIQGQGGDATINVNVTADDKFLFVSNERARSITVIDLEKARASGFERGGSFIVGRVPVGFAPIALVFSRDGKTLYTTSEVVSRDHAWPHNCRPEGHAAGEDRPQGALYVVDVAKAEVRPEESVVAVVNAGCSPVRMAIAPNGDLLHVTARNSDAMLSFSPNRLVNDPSHALLGAVPVGPAPVPVAVTGDGSRVLVGNSNRFASRPNDYQDVTVIDAARVGEGKAAVIGKISAQGFPREFAASADGHTLFLANFASNSLEVIDVERLPAAIGKK